MESVIRVKKIGSAFRITRTASGLWIEILDPNAEPLSLDRWDLAELGLVFEEDAEVAERQRSSHDPRLIEVLSELGIAPADPDLAETDLDDRADEGGEVDAPDWLVNDKSLVDN